MVTKDDFWNFMCDTLEYRFFSGVACKGFDILYKRMPVSKMHYIPAVNERTAIYLCKGTALAGVKSAVFISSSGLFTVAEVYDGFIDEFDTSIFIFAFMDVKVDTKLLPSALPYITLGAKSSMKQIEKFFAKTIAARKNGLLFVNKGFFI